VKHRSIESRFHGYFRAFEVNYDKDFRITLRRYKNAKDYYDQLGLKVGDKNPNYKKFNPHIHTILLVDKSYFPEGSKKYLYTSDFVRLWRLSCRLDYDPTCWIRKVKKNRGKRKQIAEVAKYTTKDSSILTKNKKETDWLVELFDNVLRRRRLIAFGGILHKIARELKMDKPGEGDLINIDEDKDTIREDIATLILTYDWNYKLSHYVKRRST
jgi:plasmid rolling circle replication initiator protein Rep